MPIQRLVLILGAGASRNLGAPEPLPLMQQWNNIVRAALDRRQPDLSQLLGLRPNQSGQEFETTIGEFLAWQRIVRLAAKFMPFGLDPLRRTQDDVKEWLHQAEFRADLVVEALNTTLYDSFSGSKISPQAAREAYGGLLEALQVGPDTPLVVATTNYDPAAERGFAELDRRPDVGESAGPGGYRWLRPENLLERAEAYKGVAILHLHGKVGWYTQDDGQVRIDSEDFPYNASSGSPTVLMPDPEKDPLAEPAIRSLWQQFDESLDRSSHVLVLGHSLNDPVLVDHINNHANKGQPVGVSVLPGASDEEILRIQTKVNSAEIFQIEFGPESSLPDMNYWASRGRA